jgi:uncharacterized LabA/DUF88 family protein
MLSVGNASRRHAKSSDPDTVVIVVSNSDLTPLIDKLREHAKRVAATGMTEDL